MELWVAFLIVFTIPGLFLIAAVTVADIQWRRKMRRRPKAQVFDFRTYKSARASDVAGRKGKRS